MSAANEETLVSECNQTLNSINGMLIELQDNAYNLGLQRGKCAVDDLVELVKSFALSGDECKGCGGTIFRDGTQDHRKDCPVDAAMRKHKGGGE